MFNFPNSPVEGATFTPAGGPTYVWRAPRWTVQPNAALDVEAIDDRVAALLVAGDNITLAYNDAANTLTITGEAGGGGGGDINGDLGVPPSTFDPVALGNLVVEATSDTHVTFKLKGSDGVIRSFEMPLSLVVPPYDPSLDYSDARNSMYIGQVV